MITKERLWDQIAARYPDGADLTREGLRKMFNLIWAKASEAQTGRNSVVDEVFRRFRESKGAG